MPDTNPSATPDADPAAPVRDDPLPTLAGVEDRMRLTFGVLTEINIIAQLSAAAFEAALPGWTVSQFGVIQALIRRGDGKTPLDLARAFQQPKTSMTHTLQMLEKRGLIRMDPNPADGRSKLVRLEPGATDWHREAVVKVAASQTVLRDNLAAGTLEALLPHLAHLRAVMDAARDS